MTRDHVLGKPFTDADKLRHILQRLVFEKASQKWKQQRGDVRDGIIHHVPRDGCWGNSMTTE